MDADAERPTCPTCGAPAVPGAVACPTCGRIASPRVDTPPLRPLDRIAVAVGGIIAGSILGVSIGVFGFFFLGTFGAGGRTAAFVIYLMLEVAALVGIFLAGKTLTRRGHMQAGMLLMIVSIMAALPVGACDLSFGSSLRNPNSWQL